MKKPSKVLLMQRFRCSTLQRAAVQKFALPLPRFVLKPDPMEAQGLVRVLHTVGIFLQNNGPSHIPSRFRKNKQEMCTSGGFLLIIWRRKVQLSRSKRFFQCFYERNCSCATTEKRNGTNISSESSEVPLARTWKLQRCCNGTRHVGHECVTLCPNKPLKITPTI